jgi:hypothetical protein
LNVIKSGSPTSLAALSIRIAMPAERAASSAGPTNKIDQNGVPTIASSVPLVLLGAGFCFGIPLFAIGLFETFRAAATGVATDGRETWDLPQAYRLYLWVTGALGTLLWCWYCAAAFQFFQRRTRARSMIMAMFVAVIGLNFFEAAWEIALAPEPFQKAAAGVGAVAAAIVPAIWLVYFWRSQWVRRVFVYPLADAPAAGAADPLR